MTFLKARAAAMTQAIGYQARIARGAVNFLHGIVQVLPASLSVLLLSFAGLMSGQFSDTIAQRGIYPNGTYSFDQSEAINKQNGLLTYSIPITSLPLGRAGMSVPVNLVYNSALADAQEYTYAERGTTVQYGYAIGSPYGGWRLSGFNYGVTTTSFPAGACGTSPPPFQFSVLMPDGAHHVLKLYNQPDPYANGTYWINPDTGQNICTLTVLPNPLVYYTVDGSYIRVLVNASTNQTPPNFTIYLPDGMTVAIGQTINVTKIRDRNGNQVTINYDTEDGITTLTDDLGRSVQLTSATGAQGLTQKVTQTGADGNPLTWTLSGYQQILGHPTCITAGPQGCGAFAGGGPTILQVPSDSGILQYSFGYDASSGELTSVTLPSGAKTSYTYGGAAPTQVGTTQLFYNWPVTNKVLTWVDQADGVPANRSEAWTYAYSSIWMGGTCTGYCTKITAPDNGVATTTFYGGNSAVSHTVSKVLLPDGSGTEYLYAQNPSLGENPGGPSSANPFVSAEAHIVAQGGSPSQASVEQFTLDQNGNIVGDSGRNWTPYSALTHDSNGNLTGLGTGTVIKTLTSNYQPAVPASTTAAPSDNANAYWNPAAPALRSLRPRSVVGVAGTGAAAEYSYDANGNNTQERHWNSVEAAALPSSLNASNSNVTQRTYDSYGNLKTSTDPNGVVTVNTYDANSL